MRCALDATPLLGERTGVATFTGGALGALALRSDTVACAYALSWRGRTLLREVLPEGVTSGWAVPAGPLLRLWARSDLVPIELIMDSDEEIDVVHGTNFVVPPARRAARVVTVHDLTAVRYPEMTTSVSRRYPALVRRAVERGAWVHTPSAFVADEVCASLGARPERVRVVAHGVDPVHGSPSAGSALARGWTGCERYVLAVGTVEPRKDLPMLVRAFDQLADADPSVGLVLAGAAAWGAPSLAAAVDAARHRDRIAQPGYVSDDDRGALMAGAAAFAFPSRYEGFGLPPLEAMTAGVPVVATAAGAVPEVCGDAALLVAVGDADAFADGLQRALAGVPDLVAAGRDRAAGFTWERCADGLVELYRDCLDGHLDGRLDGG